MIPRPVMIIFFKLNFEQNSKYLNQDIYKCYAKTLFKIKIILFSFIILFAVEVDYTCALLTKANWATNLP